MNQVVLLIQKFQKLPSWFNGLTALFFLTVLCYIDSITNFDLFLFYLIPVSLAILLSGVRIGSAISALSLLAYWGINYFANPVDPHLWDAASTTLIFVAFAGLNIKIYRLLQENKRLKAKDDLTGILNVQAFFRRAEEELQRSHRYKRPVTLAYMDCSRLKQIKKELNFKTEQEILQNIARILRENLRTTDIYARIDEENFLLMLPEVNANGAKTALQKIQSLIRLKSIAENWPLEFNIGAITFNQPPASLKEALISVSSMAQVSGSARNYLLHEQVYN